MLERFRISLKTKYEEKSYNFVTYSKALDKYEQLSKECSKDSVLQLFDLTNFRTIKSSIGGKIQ